MFCVTFYNNDAFTIRIDPRYPEHPHLPQISRSQVSGNPKYSFRKSKRYQSFWRFWLKRYKLYLAKRQKYEAGIVFIWILTVTPSYLYGKDIDLFLLLGFMVFTYLFIVLGNFLFQKIKNEVKEIESQVNHLATTETSLIWN